MEILKIFIYILTGAWFSYFAFAIYYILFHTRFHQPVIGWQAIVLSAVLGSASLAFYLGD